MSLEYRILIEVHTIVNNTYDPDVTKDWVPFWDNPKKFLQVNKPSFNTKTYQICFTNRIINIWNSLSEDTVTDLTLNGFKNKFDRIFQHSMYCTRIDKED